MRRTNASVWADVVGGMSLEASALKLKLCYFGHVIRAEGLEKDFMLEWATGRGVEGG